MSARDLDDEFDVTDDTDMDLVVATHADFVGECTCPHEPDDHDYTGCRQPGCACTAHWTEEEPLAD